MLCPSTHKPWPWLYRAISLTKVCALRPYKPHLTTYNTNQKPNTQFV